MANVMVLSCAQVTVNRIWELVKETSGTILPAAHSFFTGKDMAFFLSLVGLAAILHLTRH